MTRLSRLFATAAATVACGIVSLAHATTISIGLQTTGVNGGAIATVATDNLISGSATYTGSYGSFNFNSVTATGAPIRMPGNLSTTSVQVSNVTPTAGTIYVYITEQGLTSPIGATNFLSAFTTNMFTGGTVSVMESTFFSNTNALFGGTQLASTTFTGQGVGSSTNLVNLTGTYSETIQYAFTMTALNSSANSTTDLTATAATAVTPEPSSLMLLGTGLIGTATTVLRRRKLIA